MTLRAHHLLRWLPLTVVLLAGGLCLHSAPPPKKAKAAPARGKALASHGKAAAHGKKAPAKAAHSAGKSASVRKAGSSTKAAAKGKKGRIPRTQRTVRVSPIVRETAAERVERTLAGPAAPSFLYPDALHTFFKALALEQAERAGISPTGDAPQPNTGLSRTVRVLQFGDSHTAADLFTGELRAQIQQQFGDGGLGFQFPGHPFAGYHLSGSVRSQSPGWVTEGNRFTALGDGDLGLGGLSIATSLAGQTIDLEAPCDTLQLHFLRQPGGGRLQFTDNGTPISIIETASDAAPGQLAEVSSFGIGQSSPGRGSSSRAGTFSYACAAGPHQLEFTTLDHAPVKLLGIVTEQPGVTWECLGINGAVAPLMLRWNQALFADYLSQRAPDLIVLAYGTNEAGSSTELATYPANLAQLLDNLHRMVPSVSILLLGPAERDLSSGRGRRLTWHPLAGVDRVITMQKEACRTHGCAFWDTQRRMGGPGSMPQWVAAGWAQPDGTHLTGTGYRALADALYGDLIRAYNLYQQHPNAALSPDQSSR